MLKLDLIHTLAFGGLVLFFGHTLRRAVPVLGRYNLPAPVLGGLLISLLVLATRHWDRTLFQFDTTLRDPLMIAFFTTVGFGASFRLLKKGGPQVLLFFLLSTIAAVLQNVAGASAAHLMGEPPLFGVLCGSVTLTGGPATGLAFAPQFEEAGVVGAGPIAVAAAMFGIVAGGIIGAPIATLLIERLHCKRASANANLATPSAAEVVEAQLPAPTEEVPVGEDVGSYVLLKGVGVILVAMWAGSWVSSGFTDLGMTLPAYIGAMLVAAALRNLDDATGWLGLSQTAIDDIGNVALSFFLVLALMTLELWLLAAAALPLTVVLLVQVALVAAYCFWPVFPHMGRDYDAAVMTGGFCGFMMGTTANAMANMDAVARRYGPAPRAFLVVPMVGAFFIDFTNAILIQACLNLFS
jgi:ESS family glutamate:Na+ symporter